MIKVEQLSKKYGHKLALDNISFTVNEGEIVGFLGPNGAGKTTTMNIITGYLSMTSGTASVSGCDILENPNGVKKSIGYLPEHPPLFTDMTVTAFLRFVYRLKKCREPDRDRHIDEICETVKITDVKNRLIKHLSKGYQQRVGLAQALIGNPPVLILDEPTVGLDPRQIIDIRNLIRELGKARTIILSSHILPEVQAVCDRIIVINKGRIVADDSSENLTSVISGKKTFSVSIMGSAERLTPALSKIEGVSSIKPDDAQDSENGVAKFLIQTDKDLDIRKSVFDVCVALNTPLVDLHVINATLEDVFINLTGRPGAAGGKKKKRSVKNRMEGEQK